jgi:hypothetical protein
MNTDIRVHLCSSVAKLPFASIAAGFALFAADLSSAPWLGHAVSFPFGCTENIHPTPKRLANAHSCGKEALSGPNISQWRRFFLWWFWHGNGYVETSTEGSVYNLHGSIQEDLMIQLDSGNVLLKPSHRKQLMAWLKRAMRIGQRLGNFLLQITMKRTGRSYEVNFAVQDSAGNFNLRMKRHDWRDAVRDLSRMICVKLQGQRLALE